MQIKQTKHGGGRVMPEAARRCCPVNMYISQSTKPPQAQKRLPEAAFRPALLCYVDVMISKKLGTDAARKHLLRRCSQGNVTYV